MNFMKKWFGAKEQKDCCQVIIEEVKDGSCCSKHTDESSKEGEKK